MKALRLKSKPKYTGEDTARLHLGIVSFVDVTTVSNEV